MSCCGILLNLLGNVVACYMEQYLLVYLCYDYSLTKLVYQELPRLATELSSLQPNSTWGHHSKHSL